MDEGISTTKEQSVEQHPDGYFVMCSEKSVAHCATVAQARTEGQTLCDDDPIPGTYYIEDADGKFMEDIHRSDGKGLSAQIADFNAAHRRL